LLSAADLFLAPFSDGVSARRSSAMSALQHGVPVLTTDGPLTDSLLRDANAIALTAVGDSVAFEVEAVSLAASAERRRMLGNAGRALYETEFDWPVLARRFVAAVLAAK
jgi:glycosyltransferase involved in cell wall biosynthesis